MIEARGLSDVGQKREKNEDSILVDNDAFLFMVADGMGGHLGGERASRLTIDTVQEIFHKFQADPDATLDGDEDCRNVGERLKYAVRIASQRVYDEASQNEGLSGMGTTAVGIAISDGKAFIVNVGDSRAYLLRGKEITQLTEDHSLVSEQVKAGLVTPEGARHHRLKNIITRSVGFQREVEADLFIRELEDGDLFLLCSDGLSNLVEDKQISTIVNKSNNLDDSCRGLVAAANKNGGDDNISVILLQSV